MRDARALKEGKALASDSSTSNVTDGIVTREEGGVLILSPSSGRYRRRILHVNAYGGRYVWEQVSQGLIPAHQLLGCLELVRTGYEIALAEPVPGSYSYRKPFPHDFRLVRFISNWLGHDDIIFCGHNILRWVPMMRQIGVLRNPIVSLLYAREPLAFSGVHAGVIALTPAAEDHARKLAPRARIANLSWGVDLSFFNPVPYQPEWFFACGIANRDFGTLSKAAKISGLPTRVVCPGLPPGLDWPKNVTLFDGGEGWNTDKTKRLTIPDLVRDHFSRSAATLVVIQPDPEEFTANGFTNLIEAMALGQPVIVTRTGALPGEIDVEKLGCGIHVPAENPEALAEAMRRISNDGDRSRVMGATGRRLCEQYYNLDRYSRDLHQFFESL